MTNETEVDVIDPVAQIESYTKKDFQLTRLPYDFLYGLRNNKFQYSQMQVVMADKASKEGVKSFKQLYKDYLATYHSDEQMLAVNYTEFDGQPFQLACGSYICHDDIALLNSNGIVEEICNHPVLPCVRLVNIDDNTEKLIIKYRKGYKWREITVDKEILASASKITSLAKYGIAVNSENAKGLVKYLTDIEDLNYNEIEEKNSVSRLGWINNHGFSPYVDGLVFDGEENFRTLFNSVKIKGQIENWIEIVKPVRAERNICSRIMLAASFASVLVNPCDCLPFFVHLWGGTEAGKTVALMLATSVWADPTMGAYIRTFNSTAVAQELTASFVNSLPLVYDELQILKDKKSFDDMIYKLCEGVGRDRGAKNGGVQKIATWKNCILTSGEFPISSEKSGGGAVNRIIEIDCKDKKIFTNPSEIVSNIKQNYGCAGAIFVKWLQQGDNIETVKHLRKDFYKKLVADSDVTDKQAMSASLILTADKLINEIFFNDDILLSITEMQSILTTCTSVDQNRRCYEFINDFVAVNYNKFNPEKDGYNGEIYGTVIEDRIYFIKSKFDAVLQENCFNAKAFLSWAVENKVAFASNTCNSVTKRICGKVCRCACILSVEETAEDRFLNNEDLPFD